MTTETVTRKPGRPAREWTPAEIALLGTVPDGDVAERLGCSKGCVKMKRRALGVPALPPDKMPQPDKPLTNLRRRVRKAHQKNPTWSLRTLAEEFEISHQRVQQLLQPTKTELRDRAKADKLLDGWERRDFKYVVEVFWGTGEPQDTVFMTGTPEAKRGPGALLVVFPAFWDHKKNKDVRRRNYNPTVVKLVKLVENNGRPYWQAEFIK